MMDNRGQARRDRSNPHLNAPVTRWGDRDAPIAILAVHGRGQSPSDLRALSDRIGVRGVEWFAPTAASSEWYPYRFMEPPPPGDPSLAWSLSAISDTLDQIAASGRPIDRVVLLGFSQGACLASEHVLTRPRRYGGVVLLTGGYLGREARTFDGDLTGVPVVLATSADDDWVPLKRVQQTTAALREAGAQTTLYIQPGAEHGVSADTVAAVRALLQSLGAAADA